MKSTFVRSRHFTVTNAFAVGTGEAPGGNPAGVFPHADGLTDAQMAAYTRQLNLVECVFVLPARDGGDRRLRYFTPAGEIPVAGHPSVAAWATLAHLGELGPDRSRWWVQENLAGHQEVLVEQSPGAPPHVSMVQPPATTVPCPLPAAQIAEVFGLDPAQLHGALPCELVHSGLGHLVVPVAGLAALEAVRRDVPALAALCSQLGVREAQLYCEGSYAGTARWHTRNLCPREGLEDPACGVGNGALAVHLSRHVYDGGFQDRVEQGHVVGMPSVVTVTVEPTPGHPPRVLVGGAGIPVVRGEFLP